MTKNYIENYFYNRGIIITIGNKNIHGRYNIYFMDRFIQADTIQGLFKLCKEDLASRIIASNGYVGIVNIVYGIDDYVVLNDLSIYKVYYTSKGAYFNYGIRYYLSDFIKL